MNTFARKNVTTIVLACIIAAGLGIVGPIGFARAATEADEQPTSQPSGPRAIPAGPDVPTAQAYTDAELQMARRMILDAYKAHGKRSPGWDDSIQQFFQRIIESLSTGLKPDELEWRAEIADKAIQAGCEDPMVWFWHAKTLMHLSKIEQAEPYFRKAREGFVGSDYSVAYVLWSTDRLWEVLDAQDKRDEANQLLPALIDELAQVFVSGAYKPSERRILLHDSKSILNRFSPQERLDFYERLKDVDNVDKWVLNMIAGRAHIRLAWDARSGDWAYKVTEEGWKGFAKHMAKAREHLTKAWQLDPQAPEPANEMITVAMAGYADQGQTERLWFDRAVAAQLDYLPAYRSLRWAMRPRWGGSRLQIYKFGLECAATKRYDTWVPAGLFWALHDIADDLDGDWKRVFRKPGVYENLQEMLDGYAAAENGRASQAWVLSMKAVSAWQAGRWHDARESLDAAGVALQEVAFTNMDANMDVVIAETYARTGKGADDIKAAELLIQDEQFDQAAIILKRALSKTVRDSRDYEYLSSRSWEASRMGPFAGGEWVDIMPDEELVGWRVVAGTWQRQVDRTVTGTAVKEGLRLSCVMPFSGNIEIEGTVEFVHAPYALSNATIVIGGGDKQWWRSVVLFFYEKEVFADFEYHQLKSGEPVGGIAAPIEKKNDFRIQIWQDTITLHINGKCVVSNQTIEDWEPTDGLTIGLGGHIWYPEPKLKFAGLRVKKLTQQYVDETELPTSTSMPDDSDGPTSSPTTEPDTNK